LLTRSSKGGCRFRVRDLADSLRERRSAESAWIPQRITWPSDDVAAEGGESWTAMSSRPLDSPRHYLIVTAREPLAAAVAVRSWPDGPPDLCVTSPSSEARDTAIFAADGHSVTAFDEPLLARREPWESWDDFRARFAEGLRVVSTYDTRAALVVCDEVPDRWTTPLLLDGDSILELAGSLESEVPLP
jgi:hypothetical protein